jgi:hypothetical protein
MGRAGKARHYLASSASRFKIYPDPRRLCSSAFFLSRRHSIAQGRNRP